VPLPLLLYVGEQLQIQTGNIEEYFHRQPTRSEHLREIIDLYGFRFRDKQVGEELTAWMKAEAHRWHTPTGLLMALLEELRRRRVILPALNLLEDKNYAKALAEIVRQLVGLSIFFRVSTCLAQKATAICVGHDKLPKWQYC
jgi:hypothetical protein